MKRILHILPQFQPGGGMEHVVMNYFEHICHKEYQFDILTHKIEDDAYVKAIRNAGGQVYLFPKFSVRTLNEIKDEYRKVLTEKQYDIVHCHMANASFLYLYIASQLHVPLRILHSHQDHYGDKLSHTIRNIPLIELGKRYANAYVACSKNAGTLLFKKREYTILKNGIDIEIYAFSKEKRRRFRENIRAVNSNTRVFGIIGRFVPQKNIKFAIDVFNSYRLNHDNDVFLVIAGDGEMKDDLHKYAHSKGLDANVLWFGNIKEIDILNSGIDILLMPSLYEGLPLSLIEAQCAGVQCYVSTNIVEESCVNNYSHRLSLSQSAEVWAKTIFDTYKDVDRFVGCEAISEAGYDIRDVFHDLMMIYNQI